MPLAWYSCRGKVHQVDKNSQGVAAAEREWVGGDQPLGQRLWVVQHWSAGAEPTPLLYSADDEGAGGGESGGVGPGGGSSRVSDVRHALGVAYGAVLSPTAGEDAGWTESECGDSEYSFSGGAAGVTCVRRGRFSRRGLCGKRHDAEVRHGKGNHKS